MTRTSSINPLEYKDAPSPGRCAWVVFLLTTPSYLPGVLVLNHSLKKHRSKYPLIVAVNPQLPAETVDALQQAGLDIRVVQNLAPKGKVTLIAERFADTWTKCAVFDFVEYDRLVLIDGDMMLRQNMDELFNIPLQPDQIAATFACVCNLDGSSWAPTSWTRENCGFTQSHGPSAITRPGEARAEGTHSDLNSGLVVLTPSKTTFNIITSFLLSGDEKISSWMFPDQDLLAEIFRSKWVSIPWIYNAIKTMRYWHGHFYQDEEVRNLHYIVDKPWRRRPKWASGSSYQVDAGEFIEVKDLTLGIPSEQADAVTHGWWWEEYEEMTQEMRNSGYPSLMYLEKLVDGT